MAASTRARWAWLVILLGIVYLVDGVVFSALTQSAASNWVRPLRLASWLIAALAFAGHVGHERFRLRSTPLTTALHVSMAAALGAFGLAGAALVHALSAPAGHAPRLALALVAWPVLTGVPAFVVALGIATLLARLRPGSPPR
jgi:hypothetical protein